MSKKVVLLRLTVAYPLVRNRVFLHFLLAIHFSRPNVTLSPMGTDASPMLATGKANPMQTAFNLAPVTYRLPDLPRGCGSWVVLDRRGNALAEFFASERAIAERVDATRFAVVTAAEYLAHINGSDHPYSLGELAWQIIHMDYLDGRAPTLADAAAAFDAIAAL